MPRTIRKIETSISTSHVGDVKQINTIGYFDDGFFVNCGNFTGFMQCYGVGNEIIDIGRNGSGYKNDKPNQTINISY